ncbi:hypothetical protein [Mesorhizobium sp. M0276]
MTVVIKAIRLSYRIEARHQVHAMLSGTTVKAPTLRVPARL